MPTHRRTALSAVLITTLLLMAAPSARAQVYGQYSGARTVPMNGHLFGAYLNASNNVVGLSAQLRLSFYPNVDFGFQGGFDRVSFEGGDRTTLRLGPDFKILVASTDHGAPLDIAVGGALGVESGDNWQVLSLGPQIVASRDYGGTERGATVFAGAQVLFSNIDVGPDNRTDTSVPLRGGVEWRVAPDVRLTGEVQLRLGDDFNDDVGLSVGVHLPF